MLKNHYCPANIMRSFAIAQDDNEKRVSGEGRGWLAGELSTNPFLHSPAKQITVILNETKWSEESHIHFNNFIG